jgi:hypothetical protein
MLIYNQVGEMVGKRKGEKGKRRGDKSGGSENKRNQAGYHNLGFVTMILT